MTSLLRRKLRRRRPRVVAAIAIASLALSVGMAHSAIGSDHMGEAVVTCLAIGVATVALAAAPGPGREIPDARRAPRRMELHTAIAAQICVPPGRARGHRSLLQVVRR